MSKTIKNNKVRNAVTKIPVGIAFPCVKGPFFVDSVRKVFEYVNNERTEKVLGYRYEVASERTRDTLDILVEQDTPIVTDEDIQANAALNLDVRINVDLTKVYCRPKDTEFGTTEYTFFCKSDAISLVKATATTTTSATN